ncbi:MAG: uL15 family ribosomal protein [Candidatus Micrarchaeia archaeon]
MVVRKEKRSRKYLGSRRWGVGNIKNARGAGDRGGVGQGRRKHRFTYFTAKAPELIGKKGFTPFGHKKLREITLAEIGRRLVAQKGKAGADNTLELRGYKVLSNGSITSGAVIKAAAFSKKAAEKIEKAGGKAVLLKSEAASQAEAQ